MLIACVLQICILGAVFARMSPDQKSRLVEELQDLEFVFFYDLSLYLLTYLLLDICYHLSTLVAQVA